MASPSGENDADLIRKRIVLRDGTLRWRDGPRAGEAVAVHPAPCGYRRIDIGRRHFSVHRVIWLLHHGHWPLIVDHINRDRSDNRIENLREVDACGNQRNRGRRRDNSSGYPGVHPTTYSGKWAAQIRLNGRRVHLGTFASLSEAIAARRSAEREHGFTQLLEQSA